MSEIYLTKIERKTIFTKSLIFVLIMFIISDLTVTGPFYFNFIPWLYILGVIGSIKKVDSILMCIIGTFTVFVSSLIVGGGFGLTCILSTVITLITLILGIITGRLIFEFILEHRLVKYIKPSKKTAYIVLIIFMAITSFVLVGAHKGNLITYLKSHANFKKYITSTYNTNEYEIVNIKYSRQVPGKYVYTVKIDSQEVYFVPVTKDIFKDANLSERLEILNNKLKQETSSNTKEILSKYPLLSNANVDVTYKLEYTKFGIKPDTLVMQLSSSCQEENMDELYDEIVNFVKEAEKYKKTQKVVININEESLEVTETDIPNLTLDYIKGGFEVEEIN